MSTQITLRFEDADIAFIDAHSDSRSAYVRAVSRRDRKRRTIENEIIVLSEMSSELATDIAAMTAAARTTLDVD